MDYFIKELTNKKVVLFGTGNNGIYALEYLINNDIFPLYFVDDDCVVENVSTLDNKYRFKVNTPQMLNAEDKSKLMVIITDEYPRCMDIASRLLEKGVKYSFYSKDITTCDLLQHHLGFYNDKIGFCCGAHNNFHKTLPLFPYSSTSQETIANILKTRENILKSLNNIGDTKYAKACANCCRLQVIPNHISDIGYGVEQFSLINISCYPSICQAECIYCSVPTRENNNYEAAKHSCYPKMIAEMIQYLKQNNLLDSNCRFEFATAEITVTPFKDILLEATAGFDSTFLTNGFIFDDQIANSLKQNDSELRLSLDCGTRETFKIVKGRDLFEKVLENLRRYRKQGRMELKYNILPGINDSDKNIEGIISILQELNLKYIRLSFDYESPLRASFYGIVRFVNALERNGLSFCFHVYYDAEEIKNIIDKYWNLELQKYYEKKEKDLSVF
ncbi:radical SAM protein [Harryflintia acetispora]|uniref:Wyosine [tRNA(Phe)-imidazoG37] synthetase (Radical SAM superfamily) n=1 Tax=Harryflintia acetispora TaxID=1849041 RepID=A0A9X8Y7Z1_9FIRM|nr:radical SAM protein [Harryflintia acetispora]TCL42826.1 wyosine [tRNA(Phe)-imidazoG37] synthetase (radical SAM superfamily) [Harryflintia acetispora]